ncbi:globin domain-containing protein [Risungbinella massiliensis]|uniref:globin domain-containing protein n=1 Tax=Risungbinella massiliensis TaxID=1329796 RepID=UPI0005CC863E|nr:hypothetical protein [Risungbinella massiliensis]
MKTETSIYQEIGESATVRRLVETFYGKVLKHPKLGHFFTKGIDEIIEKQFLFLTRYLGGPNLYPEDISPPALRTRHLEFEITKEVSDAWLECMGESVDEIGIDGETRAKMMEKFQAIAYHMVNKI